MPPPDHPSENTTQDILVTQTNNASQDDSEGDSWSRKKQQNIHHPPSLFIA
jgi:hypothetical protein